jgi:hypothetical protein
MIRNTTEDNNFYRIEKCKDKGGFNCAWDNKNLYYRYKPITIDKNTKLFNNLSKDDNGYYYIPKPMDNKIRNYSSRLPFYLLENPTIANINGINLNDINVQDLDNIDIKKMEKIPVPSDYCPKISPCIPIDLCCGENGVNDKKDRINFLRHYDIGNYLQQDKNMINLLYILLIILIIIIIGIFIYFNVRKKRNIEFSKYF